MQHKIQLILIGTFTLIAVFTAIIAILYTDLSVRESLTVKIQQPQETEAKKIESSSPTPSPIK